MKRTPIVVAILAAAAAFAGDWVQDTIKVNTSLTLGPSAELIGDGTDPVPFTTGIESQRDGDNVEVGRSDN